MSDTAALEKRLAGLCGRRHAIMTGRGSSALYLAFRTLPQEAGRIAFPATLCPSPAYVALYAGFEPVFCDVSLADGNMDAGALDRLLAETPGVAAVVPAHLYGQPADMAGIEAVAAEHGAVVIEDAAQSLGGGLGGRPLGAFGAMSVLSFGHTKIVDAGHGGAVLTDDDALARRLRAGAAALPAKPGDFAGLAEDYRQTYYRLRERAAKDPSQHERFLSLPETYRRLYLFRFDADRATAILTALESLDAAVAERRRKAALYARRLDIAAVTPSAPRPGGVPWRFNVLLADGVQRGITERLRDQGFDASNWYPALPKWFASGRRQHRSHSASAEELGRRVLNLWLDDDTDDARIVACCAALERACAGVRAVA